MATAAATAPPPADDAICVLKNVGTGTYVNNGYGSQANDNPLISWADLVDGNGTVIGTHRFAYQWQSNDGFKFTLQSQFGQGLLRNNTKLQRAVYHQIPSILVLVPTSDSKPRFRIQEERNGLYLTFFNGSNCSPAVFRPLCENDPHLGLNQVWEFVATG